MTLTAEQNHKPACKAEPNGFAERRAEPAEKKAPLLEDLLRKAAALSSMGEAGATADIELDEICRGPLIRAAAGRVRDGEVVDAGDGAGLIRSFLFKDGRFWPYTEPRHLTAEELASREVPAPQAARRPEVVAVMGLMLAADAVAVA